MSETLTLRLSVKLPWWIGPYVWFWTILAFLGVPVNIDKCVARVRRHTKVEAVND